MLDSALAIPIVFIWLGLMIRYYPRLYVASKVNTFQKVDIIQEDLLITQDRDDFLRLDNAARRDYLITQMQLTGLVFIGLGVVSHIAVLLFGHVATLKLYFKFLFAHLCPSFIVVPMLYFQFQRSRITGRLCLRDNRSLLKPLKLLLIAIAGWAYSLTLFFIFVWW